MFTTYVKGFTSLKHTNICLKDKKTVKKKMFMFEVVIPRKT